MAQSLARIVVHVIFSTKHRPPTIPVSLRPALHAYLATVLESHDCRSIQVGGTTDHVHALFALSRTQSLAAVLEGLKTSSSKWMKRQGGARLRLASGLRRLLGERVESLRGRSIRRKTRATTPTRHLRGRVARLPGAPRRPIRRALPLEPVHRPPSACRRVGARQPPGSPFQGSAKRTDRSNPGRCPGLKPRAPSGRRALRAATRRPSRLTARAGRRSAVVDDQDLTGGRMALPSQGSEATGIAECLGVTADDAWWGHMRRDLRAVRRPPRWRSGDAADDREQGSRRPCPPIRLDHQASKYGGLGGTPSRPERARFLSPGHRPGSSEPFTPALKGRTKPGERVDARSGARILLQMPTAHTRRATRSELAGQATVGGRRRGW